MASAHHPVDRRLPAPFDCPTSVSSGALSCDLVSRSSGFTRTLGGGGQHASSLGERADAEGKERHEGDVALLADLENPLRLLHFRVRHARELAAAAGHAVEVLHANDGRPGERELELCRADVRQREMADLPFVPQGDHRIELLGERHRSVLAHVAEVHDVEDVASKLAEIGLAAFAQLLGTAEEPPTLVGRPSPSKLRRDDEAFGVRV